MDKNRNQSKPVFLAIAIVLFLIYGFLIVFVSALMRKNSQSQAVEEQVYFQAPVEETPQTQEDKLKQALKQSLQKTQANTAYQEDLLEQKQDERKTEIKLEKFKKVQDELLLERQLNISR